MAHTLRAALAAKGLNITASQSLELIAQAFGVADWNILSAAIRQHYGWGQLGHLQIPGRGRQRLTLLVLQYPNGVHVPGGQ